MSGVTQATQTERIVVRLPISASWVRDEDPKVAKRELGHLVYEAALSPSDDVPDLEAENRWLREGLEQALKDLQDDRKSLAVNAIKGTLAGKERCW